MLKNACKRTNTPCLSLMALGGLLIAIAGALVLAGCGAGTSGTTGAAATTTTVAVGSVGPVPLEAKPYAVSAAKGKLDKTELVVPVGSAVAFKNAEDDTSTQYHLVADDGSFDTMVLNPGAEFVVHFTKGGAVAFHDELNPNIKGTVVVSTVVTAATGTLLPPAGAWIGVKAGRLRPVDTEVGVGESVTFVNSEDDNTTQHRLVAADGSFDTGVLRINQQFSFTFQKTGIYPFHDQLDVNIKGTITVK